MQDQLNSPHYSSTMILRDEYFNRSILNNIQINSAWDLFHLGVDPARYK